MKIANLRIIADDFGLTKSVNDGIVFLLKENKINGASLMADGGAVDDAIIKLKGLSNPNLGIHFVLVEEKSLSGVGLSKNYRTFFIKYILGLIKLSEVEKELKAQLEKIISIGLKPNFINSHQHLHLLPGIMDIIIRLAKERQIPYVRTVNEIVFIPRSYYKYNLIFYNFFRFLQLIFLRFLSKLAKRKLKNAGLKYNDFFVGFMNAGNIGEGDIKFAQELAQKHPDKVIELSSHPGYENEDLRRQYGHWGNYSWKKELKLLEQMINDK